MIPTNKIKLNFFLKKILLWFILLVLSLCKYCQILIQLKWKAFSFFHFHYYVLDLHVHMIRRPAWIYFFLYIEDVYRLEWVKGRGDERGTATRKVLWMRSNLGPLSYRIWEVMCMDFVMRSPSPHLPPDWKNYSSFSLCFCLLIDTSRTHLHQIDRARVMHSINNRGIHRSGSVTADSYTVAIYSIHAMPSTYLPK